MFTIQQGEAPLFYRDRMYEVNRKLVSRQFHLEPSSDACFVRHRQLEPALQDVILHVLRICTLFNKYLDTQPLDLLDFQEAIVSICYRLLRFRTLSASRQISDVQSAYHIGLLVFMMTLFLQNNQSRMIRTGFVTSCVKCVLDTGLEQSEDEMAFWLLILGGMWGLRDDDEGWIISRLQGMALKLGIMTWDEAQGLLERFPWIGKIHDQPGRKLWDQVGLAKL